MFHQPIFQYIKFLSMGPLSPLHTEYDFQLYLKNIKDSWEPLTPFERSELKVKLNSIQNAMHGDNYKNKIDQIWDFVTNLCQTPLNITFLKL
tara:strand:- start:158 stop:433 length:276 start_codon:yes stop_codon:yes gene_type:complete